MYCLLVVYFDQYSWALATAFDPAASESEQMQCIERFPRLPKDSKRLDPGLGRRLRDMVECAADLFEPELRSFMQCLFERIVVTSTYVERVFKYRKEAPPKASRPSVLST